MIYEVYDEKQRFCGLKTDDKAPDGSLRQTHTYSYLGSRRVQEELGEPMGLDNLEKKITEEERKE